MKLTLNSWVAVCSSVENIVGLSLFGTKTFLGPVNGTQIVEHVCRELMSALLQLDLIL